MGLISTQAEVKLNSRNIKYFESLGYVIPKIKDKWHSNKYSVIKGSIVMINIEHLTDRCMSFVDVKCDGCGEILSLAWGQYKRYVKENGNYFCQKCSINLYANETLRKSLLSKGKTFKTWCLENSKECILDLWDYELNKYTPEEVGYGSNIKCWFKCPRGLHRSELRTIGSVTRNIKFSSYCTKCNSFAQYGIDNSGIDFLDKYWDYKLNQEVDPWLISKCSTQQKVWIVCQEKDYHSSYEISCAHFLEGKRCPYCASRKVHPLDSLGQLLEDKGLSSLWSDKNKISPFQYSLNTAKKAWWKCPDGKHNDYFRKISETNTLNFRCPECSVSSIGELKISECLIANKISYIPQQSFKDLYGAGNGSLSFDFDIIVNHNTLIEYQGIQHYKPVAYFGGEKAFKKQQLNDETKREYCIQNEIKLLTIPYWDYDNIEDILSKQLNILPVQEAI